MSKMKECSICLMDNTISDIDNATNICQYCKMHKELSTKFIDFTPDLLKV